MKIIVRKVTLVAPPSPPFVGTKLVIELSGQTDYKIGSLNLASGKAVARINWGDGMTSEISESGGAEHTYAKTGRYEIALSDDIATFTPIGVDAEMLCYAPFIVGVTSNATLLGSLGSGAFSNCSNLTMVDFGASSLEMFNVGVFENCTALSGSLSFGHLSQLGGPGTKQPFKGCTGRITELHFAKANEAAITSSRCYQRDPSLGTGTAQLVFDL